MRSQLNNIDVKRPDGSIVSLKEQAAQNLAKKKNMPTDICEAKRMLRKGNPFKETASW